MTSPLAPIDKDLFVLVVDDRLVNRQVAQRFLSRFGITPKLACNGIEAITYVEEDKFDLVLMDIYMKDMSGFEATQHIRENEDKKNKHTLIVAYTAHEETEIDKVFAERDFDSYLMKPIDTELFTNILRAATLLKGIRTR